MHFKILFVSLYCNNLNHNIMETPSAYTAVSKRSWNRSTRSVLNRLDEMLSSRQITIDDFASCVDLLYKLDDIVANSLI